MSISRRQIMLGAAAAATVAAIPSLAMAAASLSTPLTGHAEPGTKILFPCLYGPDGHRIAEENCYTIVYDRMDFFDFDRKHFATLDVDSDEYRRILRENPDKLDEHGIPPHIQFGGAVVSGKGDPTFHARWVERTKAKLISGELV